MGKKSRLKKERRQTKAFADNDFILNIITSMRICDETQRMVFADYTEGFIVPSSETDVLTREYIIEVKKDTLLNLNDYVKKYASKVDNYQQFIFEFFDKYGKEIAQYWNAKGELQERLKWLGEIGYDIENLH